ncbi:MAG: GEVED domain-containing protein [Planctomycetes bacterium]|nr:GEVED domain-containing protein [Planctomycetota bacterium]
MTWNRRAMRAAAAAAGLLAAGRVLAQNDECAGAIPLVDGINGPFDTTGATLSAPPFACAPGGPDLWFRYTATCAGTATFTTCPPGVSSFDTAIQAYPGTCGSPGTGSCANDSCGPASGSTVSIPLAAGAISLLRVGGFDATAAGTFSILVACAPSTTDYGDAPPPAGLAAHTSATLSERLGAISTGDAGTVSPAWYGDAGDDGIVSVSGLFPGSSGATIVVRATNPSATIADFCRIWVDRDAGVGFTAADALPIQAGVVGLGGLDFTFGPFAYPATAPASPMVRARLSFDATGVSSADGTGSFGEVEDYVLPGTGGPVTAPVPAGGGADAGDAPLPYPPCNATFIASERLGLAASPDAAAPVGPGAGDGAWDDDADDGLVRIEGLSPGGSCTIVVRASNPAGTFTDRIGGWIDFDGDGTWDEAGEAFAPLAVPVGPVPVLATLGPLAVPAGAASLLRTRLKLSFGTTGVQAAGMGFTFGEVEDYLLPPSAGVGCYSTGGASPSIWASDPPRAGLPFTWRASGLSPGVAAFMIVDGLSFLPGGIDMSSLAPGAIPPATCFLYVGLGGILAGVGSPGPAGDLAVTVPVPPGTSGGTVFLQSVQVTLPLAVALTPVLPLTVL